MSLVLSVVNKEKLSQNQNPIFEFGEQGGSIGRNPLNDWVICDSEKFISGKHGIIFYKQGSFFITDTSTNGIYLNGSSQPIGRNNSVPIQDKDVLSFGELDIQATIVAQQNIDATIAPLSNQVEDSDSFSFDEINPLSDQTDDVLDELFGSAIHSGPESAIKEDDKDALDPLSFLDEPVSPDTFEEFGLNSKVDNSFTSDIPEPATPFDVPIPVLPIAEESSQGQAGSFIPDDWDNADLSDLLGIGSPEKVERNEERAGSDSVLATEIPESIQTEVPENYQTTTTSQQLHILLKAAGLDPKDYGNVLDDKGYELFGKMLRACMDGLVISLMARSQIKSDLRMNMTTISPVENNPIKFSINGEEALRSLLSTRNGYKTPVESIEEGFRDLQMHQLATMGAFQETIYSLVDQFNPQNLEKRFDQQKLTSLKLGGKKAQYWEMYNDFFIDFEKNIRENFSQLLGDVFAEAYEEQIRNTKQ